MTKEFCKFEVKKQMSDNTIVLHNSSYIFPVLKNILVQQSYQTFFASQQCLWKHWNIHFSNADENLYKNFRSRDEKAFTGII